MSCIYMHKNRTNGKVYIGQTIQDDPNKRWKNGHNYKTCTFFARAIEKYGWDNFQHIILQQGDFSQEELNQKQQYYISFYDTCNPQKGYNISPGGTNGISPNALPAAVEWMKNHPNFGLARANDMLKWQAEHPQEAREYRRKSQKKAAEARRKKVVCIETGIVYESATEAARQIPKTSQSKICMVCKGQRKTCGGYHWKYYEEEI